MGRERKALEAELQCSIMYHGTTSNLSLAEMQDMGHVSHVPSIFLFSNLEEHNGTNQLFFTQVFYAPFYWESTYVGLYRY